MDTAGVQKIVGQIVSDYEPPVFFPALWRFGFGEPFIFVSFFLRLCFCFWILSWEGRKEGSKERRKEGRKEDTKEDTKERMKKGEKRKEGTKEGRKEGIKKGTHAERK